MTTFFRVLTADGRGAVAVVRIWGPSAVGLVDSLFRPHRGAALGLTPTGRLRFGRAGVGVGDEVVAVRIEGATPTVEIHCHGGIAAIASVTRSLEDAGAVRHVDDSHGDETIADRIRALASEDLAAAPTLRTAEILLDQSRGALSVALDGLLTEAASGAPLDRPDLDGLIRRAAIGVRLLNGWKVVIAGRPNVGKSCLFNALAGYERSIVNALPGVTRDVVSIRTAFGGWPVELSDTAGERVTDDAVESLGIARSQAERRDADLILVVLDRSEPLQPVDLELLETAPSALVVANKCDLPAAWEVAPTRPGPLTVSAETGEGLEELVGAIVARLVPDPPPPGAAVPFREDQLQGLIRARACLAAGDRAGFVHAILGIGGRRTTP